MEEPVFVKCEPDWPLDAQQPSDFEQSTGALSDNEVKIKEDPCSAVGEEVDVNEIKVSCSDEDELDGGLKEECDNNGGSSHELHSSSNSSTTVNVVTLSDDSTMKNLSSSVDEVSWKCCSCGNSFPTEDHLKKHRTHNAKHHHFSPTCCSRDDDCPLLGKGPYSCEECNKVFAVRRNLKQHMLIHTGDKPFSCSVCGKAFLFNGYLKKHAIAHTGQKSYTCEKCGRTFSRITALKVHKVIHKKPADYSCAKCGKKFQYLTSLNRHSEQGSSANCYELNYSEERSLTCPVCHKTFSHRAACKSHMLMHSERLHACETCGKQFYMLSKLNTHRRKHAENSQRASSHTEISTAQLA